eukprot:Lankesteria_metandrocarpae@DN9402_c0_g1_i1.p1
MPSEVEVWPRSNIWVNVDESYAKATNNDKTHAVVADFNVERVASWRSHGGHHAASSDRHKPAYLRSYCGCGVTASVLLAWRGVALVFPRLCVDLIIAILL